MREHCYFVYILTNCSKHPLYTGVTNALRVRHNQHLLGESEYSARYQLDRVVYYETYRYINNAIHREKQLKRWSRKKKITLIESVNPKWDDLSREWGAPIGPLVRKVSEDENQDPSATLRLRRRSARDDKS